MAILKYPIQPPIVSKTAADGPTEATDYLVIKRKRIKYDDGSTNYYGLNLPSNNVKTSPNENVVYIAMPNQLQTAYRPAYRQVDMGVLGMAASGGLGENVTTENLTDIVQTAAAAGLPEFMNSAFADVARSASNALGLAGNFDANAIQQLAKGRVFNPYTEQLFSNMNFRTHNFTFKMFARSQAEAQAIAAIIRYIKQGAVPLYGDSSVAGNTSKARFFEVPDKFDLRFIRVNTEGGASEDLHFKMFTSVCTNVDVNYTPDGQYNAFKDVLAGVGLNKPTHVPAVQLTCSFTETRFVTQEDISNGY